MWSRYYGSINECVTTDASQERVQFLKVFETNRLLSQLQHVYYSSTTVLYDFILLKVENGFISQGEKTVYIIYFLYITRVWVLVVLV